MLGHLLDLKVVQILILCHQILNSLVDLVSGLNDHVVDVHVGLGTVGLLETNVNASFLQLLDALQSNALVAHHFFLTSPSHVLSFLIQVNDLDVSHEHLGVIL